jgi:hypothetical protein
MGLTRSSAAPGGSFVKSGLAEPTQNDRSTIDTPTKELVVNEKLIK